MTGAGSGRASVYYELLDYPTLLELAKWIVAGGRGMVTSMATRKVTITLDEAQVASIGELVSSGKAENVSQFVRHAVGVSLADVAGWGAMLALALEQTGGPLTRKERVWADSVLSNQRKQKRKRKAA